MRRAIPLCILGFLPAVLLAQNTSVITVAGGYLGDHKPALSASFNFPSAVALDREGHLYIADTNNCLIRRVNPRGVVVTVAGTGICGFSGDGDKATSARLSTIYGLAFDSQGNLFFSDSGNNRIRRISRSGIISTVAGNGSYGYSGDGGAATQASLASPNALAVDASGNLYIADSNNYVVRLVDTAGIIHPFAGNHTDGYGGDGGPATAAQMGLVRGVALDTSGNVYIAETSNRVRKVDSTGIISTVAGNGQGYISGNGGPATSTGIGFPDDLCWSPGFLYISSLGGVWYLDLSSGNIQLVGAGFGFGGDGGPALSAWFNNAWGMAVDAQGNLLVADAGNDRIRQIAAGSQIVTTVAGGFLGDGDRGGDASLNIEFGGHIALDSAGNLYVADTYNNRVRKVSTNRIVTTLAGVGVSGYGGDGGPAASSLLARPTAVVADQRGNVYIADSGNGVIRKVDGTGTITTLNIQGNGIFGRFIFGSMPGLALDRAGNLYVSDGLWAVWKVDASLNGTIVAGTEFNIGYGGDGGPATQAELDLPAGIALDNAGNLYIADWLNSRVRKVDTSGVITTIAGTGVAGFSGDGGPAAAANLSLPLDVTVDAFGNLYIADWSNLRIREVDSLGTIRTIAGREELGFNGNHLPATQTNMLPIGLALSSTGELYYSDSQEARVRKLQK